MAKNEALKLIEQLYSLQLQQEVLVLAFVMQSRMYITLTPNTPLTHTWFTYSIWNMGEFCGLKFHLIYVHTSQKNLLKSLHAEKVSFLLLNLQFFAQKCKFSNKKYFLKKAFRMEGIPF